MAYKTKPYLFLGILRRFWREYEIEGQALRIKHLLTGPSEVPLPPSAIEVKQGPLRKILGLGDVIVRSMDGKTYVCDKVPAVADFVSELRGSASPSHHEFLMVSDDTLRGPRSLTDAKGITAMALLDDGRRIVTTEQYGDRRACLALYDADSLKLLRELVFADGLEQPNAIGVVSDPERIIIDVDGGLRVIDLRTASPIGQPLPMHFRNMDGLPKVYSLLVKKKLFRAETIGIFDNGKTAVVHCGTFSPGYSNHIVAWDLHSFQLKSGPTHTPGAYGSDLAGLPHLKRGQFITGNFFGSVRFWDVHTLTLARELEIKSPPGCNRGSRNDANDQVHSMALSSDSKTLAIGSYCGAIHLVDAESGKDVVNPLVPQSFDYSTPSEIAERINSGTKYTHSSPEEVTHLRFFAGDQRLIAGYHDGSLRVWDVKSGVEIGDSLYRSEGYEPVGVLCVIPRFRKAISARPKFGWDESNVRVWDLRPYF